MGRQTTRILGLAAVKVKNLYEAFQIKQTPKCRGILDLFTISAEGGGNYMVASDSRCTSPLILKQAIKQGMEGRRAN